MSTANFALNLPPEQAIAFLKAKKQVLKGNYDELYSQAKAKAVLISAITDLEMTRDIYQSMIEAQQNGTPFGEWKKDLVAHFGKKGWIAGNEKGEYLLADPKTGEYFGTPRRLSLIYRNNMQSAYAAQRYQQQRDNAVSRPYWQYSAIMDSRTRPSHSALHGRVYRYDDRVWDTFYPPNGHNCRCYVTALSKHDLAERKLEVSQGKLVENVERPINKHYSEKTTAVQIGDKLLMTDSGFDVNVGRVAYRPKLDDYPEKLAHGFAVREMNGEDFKYHYQRLKGEFEALKVRLNIGEKITSAQLVQIRDALSINYKFAAGRIAQADKAKLNINTATVWLSDDTLVKQFNSREGQDFGFDDYSYLPDIIHAPDEVIKDSQGYRFYKAINNIKFLVVLKILEKQNEIFIQSFRRVSKRQWANAVKE